MNTNFSRATFALISMFCVCGLSSCRQNTHSQVPTLSTAIPTITRDKIVHPDYTNIPSLLPAISPTPANAASTTVSEVDLRLAQKCLKMTFTNDTVYDGSIVYLSGLDQLGILNLGSGMEKNIGNAFPIMATSPDNRFLAYTTDTPSQLHVINVDGDNIQTTPIPDNWKGVIQWLDSDTLLIEKFTKAKFGEANTIAYHIKTGNQEEFSSTNLPFYRSDLFKPSWGNFNYSAAIYNPDLSHVLYTKNENGNPSLALWDLVDKKTIFDYRGWPDFGIPQWTRDGSHIIVGLLPKIFYPNNAVKEYDNHIDDLPYKGGSDLFDITKDGRIKRLTYFSTQFVSALEMTSLSPDDENVAFWLDLNHAEGNPRQQELAVLNLQTQSTTTLCLSDTETPAHPIWSPDSKYLVTNVYQDSMTSIVLINRDKNIATVVGWGDKYAKGWMRKFNE